MTTTTKNTKSTLAFHAIALASLIKGAAARQGHTRNLEPWIDDMDTEHGTAAKTNGIGEVVDETYADADMEPIVEAPDTGVLNVNDGPISFDSAMYALGSTDIDEELKESAMRDMPSEKQWLGMKDEKKCHILRLVLGNSKFHGRFDTFLDEICPQVIDICTTADTADIEDNSVGQGGCCGEDADCFNNFGAGGYDSYIGGPNRRALQGGYGSNNREGYNECINNKCVCNEQEGGNVGYGCCTAASGTSGVNGCASTFFCVESVFGQSGFTYCYAGFGYYSPY